MVTLQLAHPCNKRAKDPLNVSASGGATGVCWYYQFIPGLLKAAFNCRSRAVQHTNHPSPSKTQLLWDRALGSI